MGKAPFSIGLSGSPGVSCSHKNKCKITLLLLAVFKIAVGSKCKFHVRGLIAVHEQVQEVNEIFRALTVHSSKLMEADHKRLRAHPGSKAADHGHRVQENFLLFTVKVSEPRMGKGPFPIWKNAFLFLPWLV